MKRQHNMKTSSPGPATTFRGALSSVVVSGLLAFSLSAFGEEPTEPPPKKPSLWQRLKTDGISVQVGRDGVTAGPADTAGSGSGCAAFGDARLWVVGFDPAGLQQ